ncbi:Bacterial regulatory proteins, tetR family [Mycobacterium basiliense]|uniref:Bacterial regulatory proteins, tetR family n=1 Tax=Mycobacterium basiliense TaxID=2094119 RepID=A0A447GGI9_9MYCO|nr:TetR family transcriptional regulator [Mycobacterium basiliense]VDM89554.1 Bacterial regulatory proteins, tetR family [Mycobacterium basiliense]
MHTNLSYMVEPEPSRGRNPYRSTALSLMHNGVLDALQSLLLVRKWSSITMADVAAAAGISRGTLYNEFQSRRGLARHYALRLTDSIVTGMRAAIDEHHSDGYGAMHTVFRDFFDRVANDPLAQVLRTEDAPSDILRLITVESQFLVDHATEQLSHTFQHSWVNANQYDATVMGQAVVRAALSYLALPPSDADEAATGMAHLLTPYIESIKTSS